MSGHLTAGPPLPGERTAAKVAESVTSVAAEAQRSGERLATQVREAVDEVTPKLRGWLHAASIPVTAVAGASLIRAAPTSTARAGVAVFVATAVLLFTSSTVYHRGRWSRDTMALLRRVDHATIFLLIAGSYTAFGVLLLDGAARVTLLVLVWAAALAGAGLKLFGGELPRAVSTGGYLALGWAAVGFAGHFVRAGHPPVLALMAAGGLLYTAGGFIHALRRPDPFPAWFGYHEVFHAFTVAAFASHFFAALLAASTLSAPG